MTANHVFYIPAMILIGFFLGALWGRQNLLRTLAEEEREAREREARRAARKKAESAASPSQSAPVPSASAASGQSNAAADAGPTPDAST